ncbi:MAG: asparagine synthase (glutamine-hydrolyzing) [Longimicrobiaceae bacterium]
MCGIVGVAASRGAAAGEAAVEAMRDRMCHRGPDDAGAWRSPDGRAALAHRRLSILDLSPAGRQPMLRGDLALTFNGEVYNYRELRDELAAAGERFATATDTEVVLAAYRRWGEGCVARLEGMFALALYDAGARRLLLARDRAGEKPLFYRHEGGRLAFASELKALLADPAFPRRLDRGALEFYLAYGYVPGERCILEGAAKLPPAHAATYDLERDALRVWRYWELPPPFAGGRADATALAEELEALLGASVRRQLVADVPVGVLLSGGLDSSLVTALAARASARPVKTFTVTFPGHGAFDEAPFARLVAEHHGTEHTELPVEPATVELLPELARQYDEPLADSSMVPTALVSRLVRRHCTVALGGDGGDELFGGYPHYNWIIRQQAVRRVTPRPVRSLVGAAAGALPVGVRGRNHLVAFASDARASVAAVNLYFDAPTRRALVGGEAAGLPAPEGWKRGLCDHGRTPLQMATAADFLGYLPDDILVKVDRASMLTSLEVRAPFLDRRVMELAFGRLPDALRATARERKVLPRMLGAKLLPPALDLRRKQGLSIPLSAWFRGSWGAYMESVLLDGEQRLFGHGAVRALVAAQRGGLNNTHRLFALTLFELWRREYGIEA